MNNQQGGERSLSKWRVLIPVDREHNGQSKVILEEEKRKTIRGGW